jgi:hypothetical protein
MGNRAKEKHPFYPEKKFSFKEMIGMIKKVIQK